MVTAIQGKKNTQASNLDPNLSKKLTIQEQRKFSLVTLSKIYPVDILVCKVWSQHTCAQEHQHHENR